MMCKGGFEHKSMSRIILLGVINLAVTEARIDFNRLDAKQISQLGLHLENFARNGYRSESLAHKGRYGHGRNFTQVGGIKLYQQFPEKKLANNPGNPSFHKKVLVFPQIDHYSGDCNRDAVEMTKYDYDAFCPMARGDCRSHGLLNYMELPFCFLTSHSWAAVLVLTLWLSVLIIWMSSTVKYSCPNLISMSKMLGINENVAGITFLAFGNSFPDVLSLSASALSGPSGLEIAVGEILGGGMFIFCVVQGMVALTAVSAAVPHVEYLRDCGVYLVGLTMTLLFLLDGQVTLYEGYALVLFYMAYVLAVVCFRPVRRSLGLVEPEPPLFHYADEEAAALLPGSKSGGGGSPPPAAGAAGAGRGPLGRVLVHLNPVDPDAWGESWLDAAWEAVRAPAVLLQNIAVPVVNPAAADGGWCRPVAAVQALCGPAVVLSLLLVSGVWDSGEAAGLRGAYLAAFGVGAAASSAVLLTSSDAEPPKYQGLLAGWGFTVSMLVVYAVAGEAVNVIVAAGVALRLGRVLLGATVLAVGVGLQDLVTNLGIAQAGYPSMAISACLGSPILTLLAGLGPAVVLGNMLVESPYPFAGSWQIIVGLLFLMCAVLAIALVMWATDFRVGSGLVTATFVLYFAFVCTCASMSQVPDALSWSMGSSPWRLAVLGLW